MTFYHFVNCLCLTFVPPFLLYKFSALSEYGTIWRCGMGLVAYMVTQVCKLMLMAVVMAPNPIWDHLIDCLGLYWFLVKQQKASLAQVKILSIALGWSLGESLFTRLIDFYINARSLQFDWKHILSAGEANIILLQNIIVCCLLWHWSRGSSKLSIALIMIYYVTLTLIGVNLLYKSGITLTFGIITFYVVN